MMLDQIRLTRIKDLILYKAYADLKAESEKTYVGYLWWIIEPIAHMAVYYLVFGLFLDRGGPSFAPFLLIGLIPWRWAMKAIKKGSNSVLDNAALMRQVHVSKVVFPMVSILTVTVKFLIAFAALLVFLWIYGFEASMAYLALPIVMVVELLFITASACFLAALLPFVPDVRVLVDNGLLLLFFLSGIFYEGSSLPPELQRYFYLNPVASLIESYRVVLMRGAWPNWSALAIIALTSAVGIGVGYFILHYFDRKYPRVVR